jgi:hypothetical protein
VKIIIDSGRGVLRTRRSSSLQRERREGGIGVERRVWRRIGNPSDGLDAFAAVAMFSLAVFGELGGEGGVEVKAETGGAVEDADEDVGEFFFEVGFVVFAEAFEGFGGFGVDEGDHGGDFVGVAPVVGRADGPAVGTIDVVDFVTEVGEESCHAVFRRGGGGGRQLCSPWMRWTCFFGSAI